MSKQLDVNESEMSLDGHLSNHLGTDELDFVELVMAIEEEFDIEITDAEIGDKLGMNYFSSFSSSRFWWSSGSGSSYSSLKNAGEDYIVRNLVELIYKKVST